MFPRSIVAALPLAGLWLLATFARAGIATDGVVRLANSDFAFASTGWSFASGANGTVLPSSGPLHDRTALVFEQTGGASTLARTLTVGTNGTSGLVAPAPGELGEKYELGAWISVDGTVTTGRAWIELVAHIGAQRTVIASSIVLDPSTPRDRWIFLATRPVPANDARLPAGCDGIELVFHDEFVGRVYLDDVVFGRYESAPFTADDGDFENDVLLRDLWTLSPRVHASTDFGLTESYLGARSLCFPPRIDGRARRVLEIDGAPGSPANATTLEAGSWFRLDVASRPSAGSPVTQLTLELRSLRHGEPSTLGSVLARSTSTVDAADGAWHFLRTRALTDVPLDAERVVVEVRKSGAGTAFVDLVQVGERGSIHGLRTRQVSCNYVARFRSPRAVEATTSPNDPRGQWGTWAWTDGPACDPSSTSLLHDPSCQHGPNCIRSNGRRDLAVTTLNGVDELPLAGAYDSRDRDVIAWHAALARAIGIDHFVFDYHGHALAQQIAAQGREDLNERALERLLDVCDQPASDLKIAAMYEPKVHFAGWVQGESTLAAKKIGIRADLSHLVASYSRRRSWLCFDGRPVVFVFANATCSPDGTQCLGDGDWLEILAGVEIDTGVRPFLVADDVPAAAGTAFQGISRWSLAYGTFLEYPTYHDFVARTPVQPAPASIALRAFAEHVHALGAQWSRNDDRARIAIPLIWPAFDDSGVAGWSGPNFAGADGAPLCVRVASRLSGAFYSSTVEAAVETGARWVQLATWNDWNEWTQIEPRWDAAYASAARAGMPRDPTAISHALGRALETQRWSAQFHDTALDSALLDTITAAYLRKAAIDPLVIAYD